MGEFCKKKYIVFVVALCGIGACYIGFHAFKPQRYSQDASMRPQVRVSKAEKRVFPLKIKVSGTLQGAQLVAIIPRINGFIRKVNFQDGQFVKAGDLLFLLDDDYLQAQLGQAKATLKQTQAKLKNAEHQYERGKIMAQKGVFTQAQLDLLESSARNLEAQTQANEAAIKVIEVQIGYTRILSPIAGIVGINNFDVGNYIQTGQNQILVTVVNTSSLKCIFGISEKYINALLNTPNEKVKIELNNINGDPIGSEITLVAIENKVTSTQGVINIEVQFPNTIKDGKPQLVPGQFVSGVVKIPQDTPQVIVPITAIHEGQKGSYTYLYNPETKTVRYQLIRVGATNSEHAVILEGVKEGDMVVTAGYIKIFDGAVVNLL